MPEYKEVKWGEETDKGYEVTVAPDGSIYYTLDGRLHREGGPAIIGPDGYKSWYLNDKLHRENGPAIVEADDYKGWRLNGKRLYKEDFTIEMIKRMDASELFTPQELAKMRLDKAS